MKKKFKASPTGGLWQWYYKLEDGLAQGGIYSEKFPGHAYSIARCPKYQTEEQWEVDAKLICATKELLDELKNIANAKLGLDFTPEDFVPWAKNRARTMIEKVEGYDDEEN